MKSDRRTAIQTLNFGNGFNRVPFLEMSVAGCGERRSFDTSLAIGIHAVRTLPASAIIIRFRSTNTSAAQQESYAAQALLENVHHPR